MPLLWRDLLFEVPAILIFNIELAGSLKKIIAKAYLTFATLIFLLAIWIYWLLSLKFFYAHGCTGDIACIITWIRRCSYMPWFAPGALNKRGHMIHKQIRPCKCMTHPLVHNHVQPQLLIHLNERLYTAAAGPGFVVTQAECCMTPKQSCPWSLRVRGQRSVKLDSLWLVIYLTTHTKQLWDKCVDRMLIGQQLWPLTFKLKSRIEVSKGTNLYYLLQVHM